MTHAGILFQKKSIKIIPAVTIAILEEFPEEGAFVHKLSHICISIPRPKDRSSGGQGEIHPQAKYSRDVSYQQKKIDVEKTKVRYS